MDTFTTVLSVFSTVCAIVFGYIAFVRNRDKDKESNVKHDATVLTEIGYIKANTDEIKAETLKRRRNRHTSGLTTSKNEWIKQSNTSGGGGFPAASSLQRRVQQ